jgi:hypothetical protein
VKKIDLKKDLKHLYQPSAKEVVQVDVPTFTFLMADGQGDPNTSQDYAQAVELEGTTRSTRAISDGQMRRSGKQSFVNQ